jgi:asparagine synthase (glutamine-hydrolysing)
MDRPKTGFGVPLADWLRGPLRDWSEERLRDPQLGEFLDIDVVRATWDQHQSGRTNEAYKLWDVLMFSEWCSR